jgi:sarcosine oxidase gamma subunit
MVEPLPPSSDSYAQSRVAWPASTASALGARRLDAAGVAIVRHFGNSPKAREAFDQAGLAWPDKTLDMHLSNGNLVARRHPSEVVVVGEDLQSIRQVLVSLTPGRIPEAMALDLSHGFGVVELRGPLLDDWLARMVDQSGIPATGRASRCRLVDIPVMLLRPANESIQLVADRAFFPYLANWLAFAHDGAFSHS